MDRYIGRCVDCLVERDLGIFGAVLIQGPKWCGKTTTAQRFAESSLSLSDPSGGFAALQLARLDPAQAIVGPTPRLVDEWQEEPKLWDAVRFECDARGGEPGQFILTGSATPRAENQPMLKSKRHLTILLLSRNVWSLPETTHRFRKLQSLDLAHKPMSLTAASKLFRWMCSRRNAVGEVKLTPQFLDLVSEI